MSGDVEIVDSLSGIDELAPKFVCLQASVDGMTHPAIALAFESAPRSSDRDDRNHLDLFARRTTHKARIAGAV